MGRTKRKRIKRQPKQFQACTNKEELILLNVWLNKHGVCVNQKLVFAIFEDTGRGVLTKKKIKAGEELINLPFNLTINITTILMDNHFCKLFSENKKQCFIEYKQRVSFQSLMACYLCFLRVQGLQSKWYIYLKSLPREYTVPYFLDDDVLCYLDEELLSVIGKQKIIIKSSYSIFVNILKDNLCDDYIVQRLKDNFNLPLYEWAYFTVNTRCVFMDVSNLVDLTNMNKSLLSLISDNTNISLCPYLDMINHSPNARNETKLIVNRSIENICITNMNEEIFSTVRFSIYTKKNFLPYTQVFICYGDSHNLKLITEYGFHLPKNDLDFVSFNFVTLKEFFNSRKIKLSNDQLYFIESHGINKDLYIDSRGLSFNFYAFLMVVKYFYDKTMDISRLIYSAALSEDNRGLFDLIVPLAAKKLENIKESIKKLESTKNNSVIVSNCVALMCQYVKILEKFIKC